MAVFEVPADDDICSDCKDEGASSEEHSLELEKRLIGNSATYAQVFQSIFEKYDREFDEKEAGGEVIDLTNEAQLQRVFKTPRCKMPRRDSSSPEDTLDYQPDESPHCYADSTHHYSSSNEEDRGCVWGDESSHYASYEDKEDRGCVYEDAGEEKDKGGVLENASSKDEDSDWRRVWEDVQVKEEFSPHSASYHNEAGRKCAWYDEESSHDHARSSDEDESGVQQERDKDVNSIASPLFPSSLSLIQPASPLLSRLHKKVVEIKKEMNWDEEERLHWSEVERKLQEQADYSSEEECVSTVRVAKSRVPLPCPSEEEEDLMSGFMVSTGEESGYEEREVQGQGFQLHSLHKHKKRKRADYRRPVKRRKLEAPAKNQWGHVPMFCTPPRLFRFYSPPPAPPFPSWKVPSPYPSTTPSRYQLQSQQSYSASPHAAIFSCPEPSPSPDSFRHRFKPATTHKCTTADKF